jgi:nucleoside-diphosphate-sugar epimerase
MAYGVPVVVARPFNTYGPRQSLRAVIPVVVAQALAGGELTLGSLTPTRDFVFVADTVEGLIRLLASDEATQGATFNIATGKDISVADVVTVVGELLGRELRVRSVGERLRPEKSEVHQLLGSPAKLRELTGWAPQTDLRTGLAAVVEWMKTSGLAARSAEYAV